MRSPQDKSFIMNFGRLMSDGNLIRITLPMCILFLYRKLPWGRLDGYLWHQRYRFLYLIYAENFPSKSRFAPTGEKRGPREGHQAQVALVRAKERGSWSVQGPWRRGWCWCQRSTATRSTSTRTDGRARRVSWPLESSAGEDQHFSPVGEPTAQLGSRRAKGWHSS